MGIDECWRGEEEINFVNKINFQFSIEIQGDRVIFGRGVYFFKLHFTCDKKYLFTVKTVL